MGIEFHLKDHDDDDDDIDNEVVAEEQTYFSKVVLVQAYKEQEMEVTS